MNGVCETELRGGLETTGRTRGPVPLAKPPTADDRRTARRDMRLRSLEDRRKWWKAAQEQGLFPFHDCEAELRAIRKLVRRLEQITPSSTWKDDAEHLPPRYGPQFPPGGEEHTAMVVAKGERRYYPPQYITTSGHSYDVYIQRLALGTFQHLLDTGYRGSIIDARDLTTEERQWLLKQHGKTRGTKQL